MACTTGHVFDKPDITYSSSRKSPPVSAFSHAVKRDHADRVPPPRISIMLPPGICNNWKTMPRMNTDNDQ